MCPYTHGWDTRGCRGYQLGLPSLSDPHFPDGCSPAMGTFQPLLLTRACSHGAAWPPHSQPGATRSLVPALLSTHHQSLAQKAHGAAVPGSALASAILAVCPRHGKAIKTSPNFRLCIFQHPPCSRQGAGRKPQRQSQPARRGPGGQSRGQNVTPRRCVLLITCNWEPTPARTGRGRETGGGCWPCWAKPL